jgi:hypothetical protein
MARGIIKRLLSGLRETAAGLSDSRKNSNGRKYRIKDAILSAFAVFYFQHPSLLNFQQDMQRKYKRSNLETLFGVQNIPCSDQMTNILDVVASGGLSAAYEQAHQIAEEYKIIDEYRVLDGGVLLALDGTWTYTSEKIHCKHCLSVTNKNKTVYYHSMLASAIVKPSSTVVLPLEPEFIRNEDGEEKQDCERNAAKRYLERKGERLRELKPTFLGDDLYACHSICAKILDMGMSFLFTCKDESHPWIAEQVKYSQMEKHARREWNGRNHLEYRYEWVNGIENRAEGEKLSVNYLILKIWNQEKDEITYSNSWITDKAVSSDNAAFLASCARTRWKIENEYNNVLKCRGYNLEHNFGHGQEHAADIYCLLNILAFLFHSIQDAADEDYQAARKSFGRRDAFFWALRYEICRYLHEDWSLFFLTVAGQAPDG